MRVDDSISFLDRGTRGEVELIFDRQHLQTVVNEGMLKAQASLDIATADFKFMRIPSSTISTRRASMSILAHLVRLAKRGVEIRLLHAGVPSRWVRTELKGDRPANLTIRRCPRLHAKAVIVDATAMYFGSANLTGAGLGAKSEHRRNFEWGAWTTSTALIDGVLQQFNMLWEGQWCDSCQRRDVCPVPLEEPRL